MAEKTLQTVLDEIEPVSADFDWHFQPEKPYRPWHDGPYHVTMGLKNVTAQDWLEIDEKYLEKLALKKELLRTHRDDVVCILPGCEESSFEALRLLVEVITRRYPSLFKKTKTGIENTVTNEVWDLRRDADTWKTQHPLEVMGLLASEDFFILKTDEAGTTSLQAGVVCFPGKVL